MNMILGDGLGSRLGHSIRYEQGLAYVENLLIVSFAEEEVFLE